MSEPSWDDYDPELLARNIAMREQVSDVKLHPYRCGPCDECAEFLRERAGTFEVPGLRRATLAQYVRHAELFGVECVYETAKGELTGKADLTETELARLRIELDAIEANRKSGRFTVGKRRRRTADETRLAVLVLAGEGLISSEIAAKLGISPARAQRLLREAQTPHIDPPLSRGFVGVNGNGKVVTHRERVLA